MPSMGLISRLHSQGKNQELQDGLMKTSQTEMQRGKQTNKQIKETDTVQNI